jgi:hypothetical protein
MRLLLLFSLATVFAACKKESASNIPATEIAQPGATTQAKSSFQNGRYGKMSGASKVVRNPDNTFEVVLDSFMTNDGPDLYVYLSQKAMPVTFIEVGRLKAVSGTQVYPLSSEPDLTLYKYICIHCKAYNHLFSYASLQ